MEKINIAKLLENCLKGMELDCTIFEDVTFEEVTDDSYPIKIITNGSAEFLTEYGCVSYKDTAKCVIFPKGKTTWEGFQRPFKDGDVVVTIYNDIHLLRTKDSSYCAFRERWKTKFDDSVTTGIKVVRLAIKEERQKLFNAIKENGYKWNAETKTLEKLIEPKFKVGDRITNGKVSITIGYIDDNYYYEIGRSTATTVSIENQDDWILDKFNIATLKPFDKVLVRDYDDAYWTINFFGYYAKDYNKPFMCTKKIGFSQCIPYTVDTRHLLGTNNDCSDYYKNW